MHKQTIALIDDDRNILTSLSIAQKEGFKAQLYRWGKRSYRHKNPWFSYSGYKNAKNGWRGIIKEIKKKTSLLSFSYFERWWNYELLGLKLGADDFVKKSGGFSIKVNWENKSPTSKKDTKDTIEENKTIISHGKLKLDPSQLEANGMETITR